jgi:hypothetical protein
VNAKLALDRRGARGDVFDLGRRQPEAARGSVLLGDERRLVRGGGSRKRQQEDG